MTVEQSFMLLGVGVLLVALFGIWKYRTPLNPLTFMTVYETGLFTLGSGIVAYALPLDSDYPPDALVKTSLISLVYLLGIASAYCISTSGAERVYGMALGLLGLSSNRIATRFSRLRFALILLCFVVGFTGLMVFSGGGLVWLTNPRLAYSTYREGTGQFVAPTQWSITFALIYYFWTCRPRGPKVLLPVLVLGFLISFMGSKGNILTLVVIAIIYYHFYVKRIKLIYFVILIPAFLLTCMGFLVAQGSFGSLLESLVYFRDYFDTSARFIARFDEFGFQYGHGTLSSLWFYVPRAIYHDKPYEYGSLLIHRVLFPGAAEQGYTPGYLGWSLAYLDFGVFGVFLDGFWHGLLPKLAYDYYRKHPDAFFAFTLMIQVSLYPVYTYAPLPFLVPLLVGQAIFLRLRIGSHRSMRSSGAEIVSTPTGG